MRDPPGLWDILSAERQYSRLCSAKDSPVNLPVGDFVGAIIDFVIIAAVVFIIVKFMMKEDAIKKI